MRSEIAEARRSEDRVRDRMEEDVAVGVAHEPRRVLDRDAAQDQAATRRETMDIVPKSGPGSGHLACSAASPTRPFSTSSRA